MSKITGTQITTFLGNMWEEGTDKKIMQKHALPPTSLINLGKDGQTGKTP